MSFYQILSAVFGDVDVEGRCNDSGLTAAQRCERSMERFQNEIEKSANIQRQTSLSSYLLKASSEEVVHCLTCPALIQSGSDSDKRDSL